MFSVTSEQEQVALNCGYCAEPFPMGQVEIFHNGMCGAGDSWDKYECVVAPCYYIDRNFHNKTILHQLDVNLGFGRMKENDFTKWIDGEVEKKHSELSKMEVTGLPKEVSEYVKNLAVGELSLEKKKVLLGIAGELHHVLNYPNTSQQRFSYKPDGITFHVGCIEEEIDLTREDAIALLARGKPHKFQVTGEKYLQYVSNYRSDLKKSVVELRRDLEEYLNSIDFNRMTFDLELQFWTYKRRIGNGY